MAIIVTMMTATAFGETLDWNTRQNSVSADFKSSDLIDVLGQVASATGWRVFVEPDTRHTVSAKFTHLPPGEALRLMLGDINFAVVPETNAASRLFVFRTSRAHATQSVPAKESARDSKRLTNELIVRLKPGAKIDDIARLLGAKVIGRIDGLNAYRLQFPDEASASSARNQLTSNPDVSAVDDNFSVDRPSGPQIVPGSAPPIQLQLKPPPDSGRVVIGLVDTEVQALPQDLSQFLLKQVSVAGDVQAGSDSPTHGTAMAETMLRSLETITKGSTSVQILPVNIYPTAGSGGEAATTTFDVANGIVAAVNGGAKIINLSLGSPTDSPFLQSVIQDVTKLNIPMFAAAGNEPVTTPYYPAAYSGVTAVTAIDNGQIAPYANRGSFVALGAPGTSLVPFGNLTYGVQGTSVASAFTSGLAAGYLDSRNASLSQMQTFLNNNLGMKK